MDLSYDRLISALFAKAEKSGVPLSGSFELTNRCTLKCKMCYIHREVNDVEFPKEKDTAWWCDLAKTACARGMLILLLTGGEPMVRSDFDEIYSYAKKLGLLVSVNTNATLIDDRRLRLFADKPPQRLNITLYGTSPETYQALCGNGDAYYKTVEAISELKKAGVNVKLNYTLTPYNLNDAVGAYEYAKENDLPIQVVSYMFPPVRSCGEAVRLTAKDAARAHFDRQKFDFGDRFEEFIHYQKERPPYSSICGERISCRAGLSSFWVTYDGRLTPCGMLNEPSYTAEDFSANWDKMRVVREGIMLPKKCTGCEYRNMCDICAAVTTAETGKSDGVPPYACEKTHEYVKLCEDYLKD